ncbi:hypothetical protein DVK00_15955 [Haloarcula sp. Atlit-47R]|uniref:hypothetical protein n=1 Tax=Haloarcula sp. Atlit-47R TaxID=2282132 RepID=UPI000EF1D2BA|nr:hypothetical protein [Haloarcula sp. Atlit-47R]RLM42557.1 hypothetical protein DVK00_15955 [Haloarcula sp. Atlit-47R]
MVATTHSWFVGAGTVLLVLLLGIGGSPAVASDSAGTAIQTQTVNTTLDVQAIPGSISYTNPARISGTLRTANGTPVATEQVRLEVENRTRLVRTDGNGSFAFQYRPRSARTGTTDVSVRYIPDQSATYRGDTATATVSVTQVTPTLTLDRSPSRLATGDELVVTTAVRVNGAGVSDIPIELRIGGTLFKRVVTGSNGTVRTVIRLPPVSTGEQTVSAVIPYEDRAIAGERAAESITVEPRPVMISMDATRVDGAIAVNGTVLTGDGRAVPGQSVQFSTEGQQQGSAETDENGTFETRLSTDALPEGDSSVTVTARFDESNTNFGTAEASATIDLSGGAATSPTEQPESVLQALVSEVRSFFTVPVTAAVVTGVILMLLEVIARRLGLYSDAVPESDDTETTVPTDAENVRVTDTTVATDTDETNASESDDDTPTSASRPTDRMGQAIAAGEYDLAVTMAYESVSDDLRATASLQNGKTHWELLEWCEDSALSADQVDTVRSVVAAYDRAAFSADSMDRASAEVAVERARDFQVDSLS